METRRSWPRILALAVLVAAITAACSVELRRPLIAYDFDNPILNERWTQAYRVPMPPAEPREEARHLRHGLGRVSDGIVERAPTPAPAPAVPAAPVPAKTTVAAKDTSPRGTATTPLPIAMAGEQATKPAVAKPVVKKPAVKKPIATKPAPPKAVAGSAAEPASPEQLPEVADAAGRLVGIRSSFDQDSFLKHVLFVSNVSLDDAPGEGLARWVWSRYGKAGATRLARGSLVFLGRGEKVKMVGIVEAVDEHGTATFIAVQGDEVKRLTVTPSRPRVRRDEGTSRIINSPMGRGRLTGEAILGSVRVVPDAAGNAAMATAE